MRILPQRSMRFAAWVTCLAVIVSVTGDDTKPAAENPAAWGTDHVGKSFPQYVTGDECLFCHRDIGPTWPENRHQLTIRPVDDDGGARARLGEIANGKFAAETQLLLGSRRSLRFLKRSAEYGKLDMLTTTFKPVTGELSGEDHPAWDAATFANRCAGCHTTAVDDRSRAFAALSLDCFTCHGDVPLEHTKDTRLAILSRARRDAREIASICGQCHLRGGRSKSSQRPYPNTFVAGDNLFRDFQVDLSDAAIGRLPQTEQHIYLSVRDVALFNRSASNCLACHDVHESSTDRHQQLPRGPICSSCHVRDSDRFELHEAVRPAARLRTHSRVCDY